MTIEKKFTLPVLPPFRLDLTAWALRRRARNRIDQWDGKQYRRVLIADGTAILALVEQRTDLELMVTLKGEAHRASIREEVGAMLRTMFSVDADLSAFYHLAEHDTHLRSLTQTFRGVKPPRFPTTFEALVNAIACQQVSLDAGISLLNRLAERYGLPYGGGNETQHAFPRPEDLYGVPTEEIKMLGFSYQKARAIAELAANIVEQTLPLSNLSALPNREVFDVLTQIRGIGRWSAEYTLLRGFGRLDVFPGDDVGAQKNLMQLMALDARPNYDEIKTLTQEWQPYAGFVYFHLLLEKLQVRGLI
jgi:DNA-3-methyladenine glycosylase II